MFLQVTKSKRKGVEYKSYLIRESFRTPDGPRSRTVCNITELPEWVRNLIGDALKKKVPDTRVMADDVVLDSAKDYGGIAVLKDAWERYRMNEVLDVIEGSEKKGLLQAIVFSRLLFPCSKMGLGDRAAETCLAEACGVSESDLFNENKLYEAMDTLTGNWVSIEKKLYKQHGEGSVKWVLYDLTSVYFEGKGPTKHAKYGYSRDHRGDRHQVIVAVATDPKGIPLHVEVLRGNRADQTTLRGLLKALKRRFGIKDAVFVFDGGMSSKLNLQQLQEDEIKYVTRLSGNQLKALLTHLPEAQQPELWDRTQMMEVTFEGKRYVIAGGSERQNRDKSRRQLRIAKAEAELNRLSLVQRKQIDVQKLASQIGRTLQRLKAHHYFEYRVSDEGVITWKQKSAVIEQESRVDGWYLIHTNLDANMATKSDVLGHYKSLIVVENAFSHLKSYLEMRPIYHYRQDRVRNHIRLCFLAFWISANLALEWQKKGEHTEVPVILRSLQKIRIGSLSVADKSLGYRMTKIPQHLNPLLTKLNLLHLFSSPPEWLHVAR